MVALKNDEVPVVAKKRLWLVLFAVPVSLLLGYGMLRLGAGLVKLAWWCYTFLK